MRSLMICQDCARQTPASDCWWCLIFSRCPGGLVHTGTSCACLASGEGTGTRSVGYTIADLTGFWVWVVLLVAALLLSLLSLAIGRLEVGEFLYPGREGSPALTFEVLIVLVSVNGCRKVAMSRDRKYASVMGVSPSTHHALEVSSQSSPSN